MKYLKNFLKGIMIGIATMVPGVSGGTMAVILGVYDDLIHAVGSFFENWKKHTILLVELGLGALVSLVLFSRILESAITHYPYIMQFLFLGIIVGGVPVLYRKSKTVGKRSVSDYVFLAIGFILVLAMSSLALIMDFNPEATKDVAAAGDLSNMAFLFIGGVILAIALILPGISGSFMLYVLGLYDVTLNAINTRNIVFLIPIGLGVIVGTLATTKLIEGFLKKYPGKTYMLILGFVLGSLISVFPGIPTGLQLIICPLAFILGFIAILYMGKKEA